MQKSTLSQLYIMCIGPHLYRVYMYRLYSFAVEKGVLSVQVHICTVPTVCVKIHTYAR